MKVGKRKKKVFAYYFIYNIKNFDRNIKNELCSENVIIIQL